MPTPERSFHMTPDELRRWGHDVVDWVADYWETLRDRPVLPDVAPGDVRAMLPPSPPQHPEPFGDVLGDLDHIVAPALTQWQHPGFHAFFPANTSGPAVLADLVSSGLGVNGMMWQTGPAITEVEAHVLDWVVELLGLPERFLSSGSGSGSGIGGGGGVIQDTASSSTLCALVAARERAIRDGADLSQLRVYTSDQAHSSLEKGARVAGFRPEQIRALPVDRTFALRPEALAEALADDRAEGQVPCLVMATVGTTSSMAVDPVRSVAGVVLENAPGAWLHVDAAMAGSAAVCPEHRPLLDGLEHADSFVFNPHKWLFTTFDCSCFYVADRRSLTDALSVTPEYLRNQATESGEVIDYRDWQMPLGRRFRALKLWFVLRWYGQEGLQHHIRQHVDLAEQLEHRLSADDRFDLAAPRTLNLVCFTHRDGDAATEALHQTLNATGRVYLTHTKLAGRYVLRASIGNWQTTAADVDSLWELIDKHA